jgi:imidazolonepropionase-like amidohydrolase
MTAAFDVVDALNPWSMLIPVNRVEGLTHAVVGPSVGDGLFAGRGAVIHLGGLDEANADMVVKSPAAMFAVLGETGAEHAGGSRSAAMARLREALDDAADLAAHRAAVDSNDRRPYSLSRRDLEALQPVIEGKLPLVVEVKRASDIEAVLRLAHDYHLKLILSKATEAWKVAPQIATAGVPVLMDPVDNLPDSFETLGATLEAAARLQKAGVTVAFATNDSHNARNLRQSAGNAVTYGMPWDDALRAITLNPARIWGLADRYGSLEPGKDADVVVWDGDPLEDTTMADAVFIHGVQMPTRTRQTELRERYRTLKGDLPPAYRMP